METSEKSVPVKPEDAAPELVEQLAAFLKAAFLFPPTNRRVGDSAGAVVAAVRKIGGAQSWVRLVVMEEAFLVEGVEVAFEGVHRAWLRNLLVELQLGGLELGPGLDLPALVEFADRLRAAKAKKEPAENAVWGEEIEGVRAVELRIRGMHAPQGDEWVYPGGGAPGPSEDESDPKTRSLVEQLDRDPELKRMAEQLRESLLEEVEDAGEWSDSSLLADLVGMLPAEARMNPAIAREMIGEVLETLRRRVETGIEGRGLGDDLKGGGAAFRVAKRFFSVRFPDELEVDEDEDLPVGLPRDAGIEDCLEDLLEEVASLPPARSLELQTGDEHFVREMLGICLHRVAGEAPGELSESLSGAIHRVLSSSTEEKEELVRQYLAPCFASGPEAGPAHSNWKVVEFLQEHGLVRDLEWGEFLGFEKLSRCFPKQFGLFLQTLSPEDPEDLMKLQKVASLLTRDRILDAAPELTAPGGILEPDLAAVILGGAGSDLMPFVEILAEHGDPALVIQVVQFLRRADLPEVETTALRAVHPPSRIPRRYLVDLARFAAAGGSSPKLREYSSFLIRRFITEVADITDQTDRRIYAIRSLRAHPTPETIEFLRELSRAGRLLSQARSARAVRNAASKTLKEILNAGSASP
jgi:hypothetical protein